MNDDWDDPIVEEVRRVREELAARYNFDIERMCRASNARMRAAGIPLVSLTPNEPLLETEECESFENDPIVIRIRWVRAQLAAGYDFELGVSLVGNAAAR